MKTKSELTSAFPGIGEDALSVIQRVTAPARHAARVDAASAAARRWVNDLSGRESINDWERGARAALLCYLEAKGLYGGGLREPGAGTQRHPTFRSLGSGRRQAMDGAAWTAAIACAGATHVYTAPAISTEGKVQIGAALPGYDSQVYLVDVHSLLGDEEAYRGFCRRILVGKMDSLANGEDPFQPGVLAALASGAADPKQAS
jgi:hypothetical protein